MKRIDRKKHIVFDDNECSDLNRQFEKMFVAADHDTGGGMYSEEIIKAKFPKIWELFCLISQ